MRITLFSVCLLRERIRKGLEELQGVRPGGDTFMHEGILRVSITSNFKLKSALSLLWLQSKHHMVQRAIVLEQRSSLFHYWLLDCPLVQTSFSFLYRPVSRYTMETLKVCITFLYCFPV